MSFARAKHIQLHVNNASQYAIIDCNEKYAHQFRCRVFFTCVFRIKELTCSFLRFFRAENASRRDIDIMWGAIYASEMRKKSVLMSLFSIFATRLAQCSGVSTFPACDLLHMRKVCASRVKRVQSTCNFSATKYVVWTYPKNDSPKRLASYSFWRR